MSAVCPQRPLFRKLDNHLLQLGGLDAGISFYRDKPGHRVLWRSDEAVGRAAGMADSGKSFLGGPNSLAAAEVKDVSRSQWNVGFGAHSGPSRADSRRLAIRPIEPFAVVTRYARSTSTPAGSFA